MLEDGRLSGAGAGDAELVAQLGELKSASPLKILPASNSDLMVRPGKSHWPWVSTFGWT